MTGPFGRQPFSRGQIHITELAVIFFTEKVKVLFSATFREKIFRARFYTGTITLANEKWLDLEKIAVFFGRPMFVIFRAPAFLSLTFFSREILFTLRQVGNIIITFFSPRVLLGLRGIFHSDLWDAVRAKVTKYCLLFARRKR